MRCASAVLDEFELGSPADELPAWAACAVNVLKAVVALISPVPGLHSAMLTDIKYLMPEGKTTTMTRDLGKVGNIMFNQVKSSPIWERRKDSYTLAAGAEVSQGVILREMMGKARVLLTPPAEHGGAGQVVPNSKIELFRQYREVKASFSELRPGAACILEADMLKIMQQDWGTCKDNDDFLGSVSSQYASTLAIMSVDGASALHHEISDTLSQVRFASSAQAFKLALQSFVTDPTEESLKQVTSSEAAASGGDLPDDTLGLWSEALGILALNLLTPEGVRESSACTGRWEFLKLCSECPQVNKLRMSHGNFDLKLYTTISGGVRTLCKAMDRADSVMTQSTSRVEEKTKSVDHYFDIYTTFPKTIAKMDKAAMVDTPFEQAWKELIPRVTTYISKHEAPLRVWCRGLLIREAGKLKSVIHSAEQVVHGAPEGEPWDKSFVEDGAQTIVDHFNATLNTVSFDQISAAKSDVRKADIGNGACALDALPLPLSPFVSLCTSPSSSATPPSSLPRPPSLVLPASPARPPLPARPAFPTWHMASRARASFPG